MAADAIVLLRGGIMKYLLAALLLLVPMCAQAQTVGAFLSQEKQSEMRPASDCSLIHWDRLLDIF